MSSFRIDHSDLFDEYELLKQLLNNGKMDLGVGLRNSSELESPEATDNGNDE